MQLEAIQQSGAEPYERNETRTAQSNGYKERSLKTRVGELILKKPQFRGQSFKSCIIDKYSRVELALTNTTSWLYWNRNNRIADQLAWPLIKTDHRTFRIIRLFIEIQDILHTPDELTCHLSYTPASL